MRNDVTQAMMDTPCERDSKNHHHWESIGVTETDHPLVGFYQIWKCSQCGKAVAEPLDLIKLSDVDWESIEKANKTDK